MSNCKTQILHAQCNENHIIKYQYKNLCIIWYHTDLLDHIWVLNHWVTHDNDMILKINRSSYDIKEWFLSRNEYNDVFDIT